LVMFVIFSLAVAFLEFASTATGTGIITASLLEAAQQTFLFLSKIIHDVDRSALSTEFFRHEAHRFSDMRKESFVPLTKIVQARLSIGSEQNTIFGATTVTDKTHRAFAAIAREGITFGLPKLLLLRRIHHSQ